ncbi:MAG: pentapeptide repeat-containing protein [Fischerella sp. CENA71]|nr:pentapeptide repeat-containing protein [Fischerella sp. CENA71]
MLLDFSSQNLRGRSFRGQNLEGANFSGADIRGADFSKANLRGANFTSAKAGLQRRWAIFLVLVSWLLSALSGLCLYVNGYFVSLIFDTQSLEKQIAGWTALIVSIAVFFLIIRQGVAAFAVAVAGAITVIGVLTVGIAFRLIVSFNGVLAAAIAFAFPFAFAVTVALPFAVAVTGAVAFPFAFPFTVTVAVTGAVAFPFAFPFTFPFAVAGAVPFPFPFAGAVAGAVAGAFVVTGVLTSIYIGWRAMKGDEKHSWVHNIAVAFAATGGTSFRGANLTDADFTGATLKSTDFRGATLIRTRFQQVKMLDRIRPGQTYLQKAEVRQLLVTRLGQDKKFDRQDLRGVNLQGANLTDASFIGSNLSEASLEDADLSRAKLVQTQLDRTDFTGATLTGAYIEDWGITSDTKFDGVRCEYVYMRLPTKENPDPLRKPDNLQEVFADGEFGDFIKPIVDTLDLYHNSGVDPRAIAIAFKQLAENNPNAELEIVAMEKRGQDKFLLRAKTAETANKSELSAEYFDTYNEIKALTAREIKLLVAEKENQIRRLENMVLTALERPSFYSNVEQVGFMTNNPDGISQNMSGGTMHGGMQAAQGDQNQQTMETNVTASDDKQLTKEDVIRMLAQIEEIIRSAELPPDTKEEATLYLGAAKKATEKEPPNKEAAQVNLKSMADTLETASKTVTSTKSLWENVKPILKELPGWLGVAKSFFGF